MPTVTLTPLFFFWKSSAAAVVYGPTVLDPSAVIVPLSAAGRAPAVDTTAAVATAARAPAAAIRSVLVIALPFVPGLLWRIEFRSDRADGGVKEGEHRVSVR